jgi:hypothetical protein
MVDDEQDAPPPLLREPPPEPDGPVTLKGLERVREVRTVLRAMEREAPPEPVSDKPPLKPNMEKRLRLWSPPARRPQGLGMSDLPLNGSIRGAAKAPRPAKGS